MVDIEIVCIQIVNPLNICTIIHKHFYYIHIAVEACEFGEFA